MDILRFALTMALGLSLGFVLQKLRVPGGMMIGAIIGAAALNVGFEAAYMPMAAKLAAQITAGAYIGSTVQKSDILHLPHILKPAAIILSLYLLLNGVVGFLVYLASPLDMATSFFGAVPGGISDIPLVAADMGANASQVALMQFVRLVVGIGVFPSLINRVCRKEGGGACEVQEDPAAVQLRKKETDKRPLVFLLTMLVATATGLLGWRLDIPAGTLVFALLGVLVFKMLTGKSHLPMWSKRLAQALSGAYIGCSMTLADVLAMRHLLVPILIIIAGYTLNCFAMGALLRRFCGMSRKEGMLAAIPAGASDMALISMDMGIQSPDLIVLQVIRLVVVVSAFPQFIGLVLRLLS